jgi:coenzyme F420-reducing hydrogenase beta subunit
MKSSSGAAFTALATAVLNKGGMVFGAAFDEEFLVYHKAINNIEGLEELRRSKYLQSRIGGSFSEAKNDLDQGNIVLFSGTPCQIAGLYSYLGRDYDNLFTCNLICKGVPSPKVFRRYLNYLEKRYNSNIVSYSFRNKLYGWAPNEAVVFANGQKINSNYSKQEALYYDCFAKKSLFLRPSCYTCPFKGLPSMADLTLGDFWSIRKQYPAWDDNMGTSLVLVNSEKGKHLFNDAKSELVARLCPMDYISDNGNLMASSRRPRARERFFRELEQLPFEILIQKYMTPPGPFAQNVQKKVRYVKTFIKKIIGRKQHSQ